MALVGNVIADAFSGNPASINYALFASVFSWIALLYGLGAAFVESIAFPILLLVLDGLAMIFTFTSGIVLAARLHARSCSNHGYLISNGLTNGSGDMSKRCRELQASTAFMWFLWASYVGSFIMDLVQSRSSMGGRGGIRRGAPAMSQI
ncbi:putative Non-classical export protein 2 [Venustampulla echinocandica]|uniref:Putative Non-classical export protein 2 n=1 Tax=Venustampulla echinocandica TaxID=2656787 RepID=A0A370TU52_9HELO|nr:putative Non-classical export protein 2 [Venustampulla echinocandica]RDL39063.1 putative Non-classical export protein 2 [Venustampulla echinocandica]